MLDRTLNLDELKLLSHKDCVRFAVFCAEQVKDGWKDIPECVVAVETTERWLEGKATKRECKVASDAAYAAYSAANATNAAYAAYTAAIAAYYAAAANAAYAAYAYAASATAYAAYANAAYAYAYAASANGKPHLIEAQWNYYEELLHFDDIAEKLLLG